MPAISPPRPGLSGGIGSFGFGIANRAPVPDSPAPVSRSRIASERRLRRLPYYGYGYGGYGYGGYGLGYGSSSYYRPTNQVQVPVYVPVGPAEPNVQLSGKASAELVLEFPAAAEVWVDGKKGEGDPHTEWTLTSPRTADRDRVPVPREGALEGEREDV